MRRTRRALTVAAASFVAALSSLPGPAARADTKSGPIRSSVQNVFVAPHPTDTELAPYERRGAASVSGRIRLTLQGAGKRYPYGNVPVFLLPKTAAAYAFAANIDQVTDNPFSLMMKLDASLARATRKTKTTNDGAFAFDNLPPGDYLVVAAIIRANLSQTVRSSGVSRVNDWTDEATSTTYYHYESSNYTMSFDCFVSASLEATLSIADGQSIVTPLAMTGWSYQGQCDFMNDVLH
jgi:hypothetical protein